MNRHAVWKILSVPVAGLIGFMPVFSSMVPAAAEEGAGKKLESITVIPADPEIMYSETLQFSALGHYSDGSTENLTDNVSWTNTPNGWADLSSRGLAITDYVAADDSTMEITASMGELQWENGGVLLCDAEREQIFPSIVSDNETDEYFIAWGDYRAGDDEQYIYIQKCTPDGTALWTPDGVKIESPTTFNGEETMTPDGNGGLYVAWRDPGNIRVQHLDADGNALWTSGGILLASGYTPAVVSDNEGGAIVCWITEWWADGSVYAQRLNSAGELLWGVGGVTICSESGAEYCTVMSPDGDGGAWIAWTDNRTGDSVIYVQKIDNTGTCSWTENGVATIDGIYPMIVPGSDDSVYISGQLQPNIQHIGANGAIIWGSGGIPVNPVNSETDSNVVYRIFSDEAGGVIAVFSEDQTLTIRNLCVQRIDRYGDYRWPGKGTQLIIDSRCSYVNAVSDGYGGTIVVWYYPETFSPDQMYCQYVDNLGQTRWKTGGLPVVEVNYNSVVAPVLACTGEGSAVIVWQDNPNGYRDIFAQQVSTVSDTTTLTIRTPLLYEISAYRAYPDTPVTFVSGQEETLYFGLHGHYSTSSGNWSGGISYMLADNWTSSDLSVVTIDRMGEAIVHGPGTAILTAAYQGFTDSVTLTVLPDVISPEVEMITPYDGRILSGDTIHVSCRVDDPVVIPYVHVNEDTPVAMIQESPGYFTQNVLIEQGNNTVYVTATDPAGNTGYSDDVTIVSDTARPDITVSSPESDLLTRDREIMISGTVSGADSAVIRVNGRSVTTVSGSYAVPVSLAEGENTIVASGYASGMPETEDYLGSSGRVDITLDTTPPKMWVVKPVPYMTSSWGGLSYDAYLDDSDIQTLQILLNDSETYNINTQEPGHFAGGFVLCEGETMFEEGFNTVTFSVSDEAGNMASETIPLYYNPGKLDVWITSPENFYYTNNASQSITGYFDEGALLYKLLVNGYWQKVFIKTETDSLIRIDSNATLSPGVNTVEMKIVYTPYHAQVLDPLPDPTSEIVSSGVYTVVLEERPPYIILDITDHGDTIMVEMISDEVLDSWRVISAQTMEYPLPDDPLLDDHIASGSDYRWYSEFEYPGFLTMDGDYDICGAGDDKAGNTGFRHGSFSKRFIDTNGVDPTVITTPSADLTLEVSSAIQDASVSVIAQSVNPAGENTQPDGCYRSTEHFLKIAASADLENELNGIVLKAGYDETTLTVQNIDEADLSLCYWNTFGGTWEPLPDSTVNPEEDSVSGTGTAFGIYGIFASLQAGDADGNGLVDVMDITKIARIVLGLDEITPGADCNGDGTVNVLDITIIVRKILGLY